MKRIAIVFSIILITNVVLCQSVVDNQWGFKLNVPSSWSTKDYMDGNDKVYDFYSTDQNAAVSVRVFDITEQITYDILIPLYEKNMLATAVREDLKDLVSKNEIPGKQAIYSMDYNGNKVNVAVFYTLQNSKAYIFTILVASAVAENFKSDIQSITASFTIDGIGNTIQSNSSQSGLAGLLKKAKGDQSKTSSSNSSIVGRYMFDYSSGDNRTNFNNIYINQNGTYKHEYQPKNSGNYIGGSTGNWKLDGNVLTLTHTGGIKDIYNVNGRRLIRTTNNGSMVYFKE